MVLRCWTPSQHPLKQMCHSMLSDLLVLDQHLTVSLHGKAIRSRTSLFASSKHLLSLLTSLYLGHIHYVSTCTCGFACVELQLWSQQTV